MTRERLDRLRKLERLRELEEDRAAMTVRETQRAQAEARAGEEGAIAQLHALAAGKRAGEGQGLDLARYMNTLAMEAAGIDAVVAAGERRREAEDAQDAAIAAHGRAAAATEVAATRRGRLAAEERHADEVRDSDRLADLRAAGGRR